MQRILLFDVKERTLDGPAGNNADIYAYYNDSSRSEINNIRKQLESWFALYPEDEKQDLKSRFKVTFNAAFYELFVFHLFTQLGYVLDVHPEVPGTKKRPDYLAKKGDKLVYIEVKHMTMLSQNEQLLERRKNTLLDSIEKVDASNFLLKLDEVTFKDNSQPSGKSIIRFFNEALSSYNPDQYTELLLTNGFEAMPTIEYDDEKVKIRAQLLPKSPLHRGVNSRSIGMHPSVTQIGNDSEDIIASLETKATRYGNLNAPYIICVNKQSVSLDVMEVQEALYGSWQISWSENPDDINEKSEFAGNGFFGSRHNPKFTRVSGVYVTNANTANLATTAGHVFRHNPFAKYPLEITMKETIGDLFNIPSNYPFNNVE